MIGALYVAGNTPLHQASPGLKLGVLMLLGVVMFLPLPLALLGVICAACGGLLLLSGLAPAELGRRLLWPLGLIGVLALINWAFDGVDHASRITLRLAGLLFAASAVTATTRTSAMIDSFEAGLRPLERIGLVDAGRVSLAIALALRFVPLIAVQAQDIRAAQAARGLEHNPVALALPLVLHSLRSAGEVADAIDARGYPPPRR